MRTGAVVDEHPQDCDQAFALFVPMARAGDDFDVSSATTVPSHVQPLPLLRPCHDSFGRWQFLPLEAWSSNPATGACRWGCIKIGVGVEPTDQGQPFWSPPPRCRARQLVSAITTVAGKNDRALGKPMQEHFEHLPHEMRWCFVPPLRRILAAVEHRQHRQGPLPTSERKADQHRQHDPLVAIAECRVRMRRTHGIAMPAFAEDLLAAMPVDSFVADQEDCPIGNEVLDEPLRKTSPKPPHRPRRAREDAMIAGGMTDVQRGGGPQHIENGVTADGEEGRQQQDHDAVIGRAGESETQSLSQPSQHRRRLLFDRLQLSPCPPSAYPLPLLKLALLRGSATTLGLAPLCLGGLLSPPCVYTGHASLLARKKRTVLIPSIPTRRLVFV